MNQIRATQALVDLELLVQHLKLAIDLATPSVDVNPDLFPNLTLSLAVDPSVLVTPIVNPDTFAKTKDVLRNPILVTLALADPELFARLDPAVTPSVGVNLDSFLTPILLLVANPNVFAIPIVRPVTFAKIKSVLRNRIRAILALVDPELCVCPTSWVTLSVDA